MTRPATEERVVIVGASHGGAATAVALRQAGWMGEIVLIGDEPVLPYHRPPLSKAWLKKEADAQSLIIRTSAFFATAAVEVRLSQPVLAIDPAARRLRLAAGDLEYDRLILATGCRARPLTVVGAGLSGVMALRTAADADLLQAALQPGRRLVIIGGGYIGLEVAASARSLGCTVVVVEREERLLARVACPALSHYFEALHRSHGVDFRFGTGASQLVGVNGHVRAVCLTDGSELECDVVLVGVGAIPNVELAQAAGLTIDDGVVVDLDARTSDPSIYAVGDVTRRPMPFYEDRMWRLESVPNAIEQARQAALHICAKPRPSPEVPWFWSDQYETKLQLAGLPFDTTERVVRGNIDSGSFAVFHIDEQSRIRSVEAVNAPAEFMVGKQLIQRGEPVETELLRDANVPMKALLSAQRREAPRMTSQKG